MLMALREQFGRWEELLARLTPEQITAPQFDLGWSIKDVMAHLWAWQQISIARVEAAALDRVPIYPQWLVESQKDWEEDASQTNDRIYEIAHEKSWTEVCQDWREGFLRFLKIVEGIPERELLDWDKYPWLKGFSLAAVLLGSYEHHQEHLEKLLAWQQERD